MLTILVAVDPKHTASPLLARAAQLSKQLGAAVTVQHVVEGMETAQWDLRKRLEQDTLATLKSLASAAGFPTPPSFKIEFGTPYRCINKTAEILSANLIIIGPGQPATVMQRVLGSTADRIVRTASMPVLVVRNQDVHPYRNLTVAIDFSPLAEIALAAARILAPNSHTELLYAYEVPLPFEQAMLRSGTSPAEAKRFREVKMNNYRRRLEDYARKYASGATARVLEGPPGAILVRLSHSGSVDLIALGTQGRNAVAQALLGSVAQRLLSEAGCDLLVTGPLCQSFGD